MVVCVNEEVHLLKMKLKIRLLDDESKEHFAENVSLLHYLCKGESVELPRWLLLMARQTFSCQ